MARTQVSSTRIYQFVFGLLFLFVAYGAVRTMMFGSTNSLRQVAFLAIAFAVVLWLDSLYWLVLPLCMALNVRVPGLPFNSPELGCLAFAGVHLVRTCLHRDPLVPWNRVILVAFPLFFWICIIWAMNPTGMHIFQRFGILETHSMGGRFYFKIVFAFLALCCLSTIRLEEKDCKTLFRVIVGGALLSIVMLFLRPGMADSGDANTERSTRYYLLAFSSLYSVLWARYSLSDILSSLKLMLLVGLSCLATIRSGKRSVTASLALIPLYRAFLTRRHRWLTIVVGLVAFILLSFAVALDGAGGFFTIPRSARRSLAMIYPKYRGKGIEGLHDTFRTEVHAYAKELIRQHPWVGRRGFRMDMDTSIWLYGMGFGGQFAGHAFAGNWHGAFWAYAADFGIPCLLFYLFFVWKGLRFMFRNAPLLPCSSFRSSCFLYYGMSFTHHAMIMFSSGHSSVTTMTDFLNFAMMVAIANASDKDNAGLF